MSQLRFAVFISGNGTNLEAIIKSVKDGKIKADLALVFSNQPKANGLKHAEKAGIKTLCLSRKDYAAPQSYDREIVIQMKKESIDFIVLAGYMKILPPYLVKQFPNNILNVHPSLLPSFKGKQGIKDTFTYGAKVGGVTIHFVNDKMDNGPIILQEAFPITEKDTLESLTTKIHEIEYRLFSEAIALFVDGRLKVHGRKVKIT